MNLYRDPEMVRELLLGHRVSGDDDRVAVALGQDDFGLFVIVGRDGRFITCLGRGMSPTGLQVIKRVALEEAMQRMVTKRDRTRVLKEIRPDGDRGSLARRLVGAGEFLTREEMLGLLALRPVYADALAKTARELSELVMKHLPVVMRMVSCRPKDRASVRAYYETFWSVGHFCVLWGADSDEPLWVEGGSELLAHLSVASLITGCMPIALRGLYALTGGKGPGTVGSAADCFADPNAACVLHIIYKLTLEALRNPTHEPTIRGILRVGPPGDEPLAKEYFREVCDHALRVLDDPTATGKRFEDQARKLAFEASQTLPEWAPGRFASMQEVPTAVARALVRVRFRSACADVNSARSGRGGAAVRTRHGRASANEHQPLDPVCVGLCLRLSAAFPFRCGRSRPRATMVPCPFLARSLLSLWLSEV